MSSAKQKMRSIFFFALHKKKLAGKGAKAYLSRMANTAPAPMEIPAHDSAYRIPAWNDLGRTWPSHFDILQSKLESLAQGRAFRRVRYATSWNGSQEYWCAPELKAYWCEDFA